MLFKKTAVWGHKYKELPIKSDFRAHLEAFKIIEDRFQSKATLNVLDIATGTGAFTQRLRDRFPDWNYSINDFESEAQIEGQNKYNVDLNGSFSNQFGPKYDLIIALEIIEHLENPWNFLRELKKMLAENGVIVLSTPNSDSVLDRFHYFSKGYPIYFGERGYHNSGGHITVVPDWLIKKIARSTGFKSIQPYEMIDTSPMTGLGTYVKMFLTSPFAFFLMSNKNQRSVNLYTIEP